MNYRNEKLSQVTGDVVIIGIDVAKRKHWASIMDSDGFTIRQPFRFDNTRDGFYRLRGIAEAAREQSGAARVVVGLEPTGHYWKPLAGFLKQNGYTMMLVNPYHVKRSKELEDNSPTKSDRKDAGLIASLVKQDKFMSCLLPDGVYADLRNLHVTREHIRSQVSRATNRLRAWLDEYFPEFMTVFSNPRGRAALWVLGNVPFPGDVVQLEPEVLAERMKAVTCNRVGMKRALALLAAASESIGVRTGQVGARQRLRGCLEELQLYTGQLERTEAQLTTALALTGVSEFLLSVPGIGVITAAGFLAEVGDVAGYTHPRQLLKLAGLNLTEQSSGEKRGQRTISKRGRPGLRRVLYQISMGLVCNNTEFKALYRHLRTRAQNPLAAGKAMVALMSKATRILFRLAASGDVRCEQSARRCPGNTTKGCGIKRWDQALGGEADFIHEGAPHRGDDPAHEV